MQDAYVAALDAWSRQGVPRNPGGLADHHGPAAGAGRAAPGPDAAVQAAAADRARAEAGAGRGGGGDAGAATSVIPDDRLRLIFTCCHPALAREAQVALTLRLVCGLTTAEIARAFLVSEPTMAARVTRAKKKISAARIPYRVPAAAELPDRLDAVLTVIHLLYTTGHTAPAGTDLVRGRPGGAGHRAWPGCSAS